MNKKTDKRSLISRNQLGNMVFYVFIMGLGALSLLYLSFVRDLLYGVFPGASSYQLLLSGSLFLMYGLVFFVLKNFVKLESKGKQDVFSIFSYSSLFLFIFLYWGSVLISLRPAMIFYILPPVILLKSLILYILMFFWRRQGGLRVLFIFLLGVFVAAYPSTIYSVDIEVVTKLTVFLYAFFFTFLILAKVGLWLVPGKTNYTVLLASIAVFLSFLHLYYISENRDKIHRDKWSLILEHKGLDVQYLTSYKNDVRKVEVLIGKDTKGIEKLSFLENGILSKYNYPLDDPHRYSFYYAMLQQSGDLGKILLAGDVPMGFIEMTSNLPGSVQLDYVPFSDEYRTIWYDFLDTRLLDRLRYLGDWSYLDTNYDIVFIFYPKLGADLGTFYLSDSYVGTLREKVTEGSLIVVLSSSHGLGVQDIVRSSLEGFFNDVFYIKQTSDLNFILATDIKGNVTADFVELKDRFIRSGISENYSKIRSYLELNRPLISSSFGIMDKTRGSPPDDIVFRYLALLFFILFIVVFYVKDRARYGKLLNHYNAFSWFFSIGFLFSITTIYRQILFMDVHGLFNVMLSMFLLGLALSVVFISGTILPKGLRRQKVFRYLSIACAIFMFLSLFCFINFCKINYGFLLTLPVFIGLMSSMILFTKYWYKPYASLDNTIRASYLSFFGFGTAFILVAVMSNFAVTFMTLNYLLALYVGLFFVYNLLLEGRSKL